MRAVKTPGAQTPHLGASLTSCCIAATHLHCVRAVPAQHTSEQQNCMACMHHPHAHRTSQRHNCTACIRCLHSTTASLGHNYVAWMRRNMRITPSLCASQQPAYLQVQCVHDEYDLQRVTVVGPDVAPAVSDAPANSQRSNIPAQLSIQHQLKACNSPNSVCVLDSCKQALPAMAWEQDVQAAYHDAAPGLSHAQRQGCVLHLDAC